MVEKDKSRVLYEITNSGAFQPRSIERHVRGLLSDFADLGVNGDGFVVRWIDSPMQGEPVCKLQWDLDGERERERGAVSITATSTGVTLESDGFESRSREPFIVDFETGALVGRDLEDTPGDDGVRRNVPALVALTRVLLEYLREIRSGDKTLSSETNRAQSGT